MAINLTTVESALGFGVDCTRVEGGWEASANWEHGTVSSFGDTRKRALKKLLDQVFKERCDWVRLNAKHLCANCGGFYAGEVHHKVFRSHGRDDRLSNLEYLCPKCHGLKHGRRKT